MSNASTDEAPPTGAPPTGTPQVGTPQNGRARVPKASDLLANQLRAQILAGEWAEGAFLPTERELVVQAGLSRASVREALRTLEMEGLIATRAGRGGGSVVCRPSRDMLERSVSTFIRGQRVRPAALLETREALETLVAGMAALHRTDEDLATLADLHERLSAARGDQEGFLRTNFEWHLAVVAASHNELLVGIVNAISNEMFRFTLMDVLGSDEVQSATLGSHTRIMDAIVRRDAGAAQRRMSRHIHAYIDVIKNTTPSPELEERLLPNGSRSPVGEHGGERVGQRLDPRETV